MCEKCAERSGLVSFEILLPIYTMVECTEVFAALVVFSDVAQGSTAARGLDVLKASRMQGNALRECFSCGRSRENGMQMKLKC